MIYCSYSEISKEKLADAWEEGFSNNNDEQALALLRDCSLPALTQQVV